MRPVRSLIVGLCLPVLLLTAPASAAVLNFMVDATWDVSPDGGTTWVPATVHGLWGTNSGIWDSTEL